MPANRNESGQFKKGKSGNPNGRPKIPEDVREMFKAATPAAAGLLIGTVDDESAPLALRMDAAKAIIERVYGKPTQPIDGNLDATLKIVMDEDARELMG